MQTNYLNPLLLAAALIATARAESPPVVSEIKAQDFYRQASTSPPKEISAKQLADWLAKDAVILIDLRAKESFEYAHIRGAINVPIELLTAEHLKTLVPNRDSRIVVYCTNNFMPTRMVALTTLGYPAIEQLGYSNVNRLEDLWSSESCRASEKLAAKQKQMDTAVDSGCESLLPMDRAEKQPSAK